MKIYFKHNFKFYLQFIFHVQKIITLHKISLTSYSYHVDTGLFDLLTLALISIINFLNLVTLTIIIYQSFSIILKFN